MDYITITYACYLPIAVAITIWVAHTLFKNGKVFLYDIFHGNTELAESVNKLLLVGFYLVNIGYVVYTMRIMDADEIVNTRLVLEKLSTKLGFIILLLGGMHFMNLFVFFRLRKKARTEQKEQEVLNPQPAA